jgi:endonuclease-3
MPRESLAHKRERAIEVCRRMNDRYPDAECALDYKDPFTFTIAVLLSAQTTDAAVNKVTPELFSRWPTAADMAAADPAEIEPIIHSIGFFHNKARNCVGCAQHIMADFGGEVPHTMEELQSLPGVGRKTANLVLNECFGIVEGIAVDTHVLRLSKRLRFTNADTPAQAEKDLLRIIPRELWKPVNHQWVRFGREVCPSRNPHCDLCNLVDLCPSAR